MANFICEAHIWSISDSLLRQDETTAIHKYYSKSYTKTSYSQEKIAYDESRDTICKPINKFRENLYLAIQDLESLLSAAYVLKIQWVSRGLVELILSNGILLSVTVNHFSGDILHIHKDLAFTGSFSGVCDALLTETCLIACRSDLNQLTMHTFAPRFNQTQVESTADVVSTKDKKPTVNKVKVDRQISVPFAGPTESLPKRLSFNCNKKLVLLWFPASRVSQNVFIFRSEDLIQVSSTLISGNLSGIQFSRFLEDVILYAKSSGNVSTVSKSKLYKGQVTSIFSCDIPTKSQVVLSSWSDDGNRIAMAMERGELLVFCPSTRGTLSCKVSISPVKIHWMPNNCCFMLLGKLGEIRFFDSALNPLKSLVDGCLRETFNLSEAFEESSSEVVAMGANMNLDRKSQMLMDVNECVLISMGGQPLVLVRLGLGVTHNPRGIDSKTILNQHLCSGKIFEAHEFLQTLDLTLEANDCISCTTSFVNHLLRQNPSDDTINYIQSALKKFYASTDPVSGMVATEHGECVTNLTRRFFKLMIRLKMFEKCYSMARDIRHKDLFMELYYAARDSGETSLADSCRRAAVNLNEEMMECDFQPDDRDSVKSLDSLDSLYSSAHSSEAEDTAEEMCQVNDRELINQLMRDTEALTMADLNDEFTQLLK